MENGSEHEVHDNHRRMLIPADQLKKMSISIQVEKEYSLCGFSLFPTVVVCTAIQTFAAATLGVLYKIFIDPSVVISILFYIHMFCAILAAIFLLFCVFRRKFGSCYEVLLHAYLLSILLMALASLFAVMFLPLSFLQQAHSFDQGMHYVALLAAAASMLGFQFFARNLVEQMLPHMEHSFQ